MTDEELKKQLEAEGYVDVAFPFFPPNAVLPEHTHDVLTAHVMLEGELALVEQDGTHTWRAGDRFLIVAGTTHSGKAGPEGCRFAVGFKP